jgi:hypothetical protein
VARLLKLDEGDLGLELLTEGKNCCREIFFYLFATAHPILLNFPFICSKFSFVF